MSKIFEKKQQKNEKDIFLTLDHMGIPFENQKVKNRTSSCLPKLGLEPKFNETGTFGGFGKRAQSLSDIHRIFNTAPYGDPLKIQNFENRASSCFKLAQIRLRAKIL